MEALLTPVSTSCKSPGKEVEDALVEAIKPVQRASKPSFTQASTAEEALELLKCEPDHETLISVLRFLGKQDSTFSITSPGPLAAQLVHVLVSDTVPNYWNVFNDSENGKSSRVGIMRKLKKPSELELLSSCLRNVTGLNAVLLNLKQRIQQSKEMKTPVGGATIQDILAIHLQLLQALLKGNETALAIWQSIWNTSNSLPKQKAIWNEFLGLVGGGKILGIAAESEAVINKLDEKISQKHWIADGSIFSSWLATNISYWAINLKLESENGWKGCSELLSKSSKLGYTENTIKEILTTLLLQSEDHSARFEKLLKSLPNFEQRNILFAVIKIISKHHLSAEVTSESGSQWWTSDAKLVSAAAGLINLIMSNEETRRGHLISWLASSSGAGIGDDIAIRRAVVAVVARERNDLETVLEKSLQQFGDQLYIRHIPTLQQEVHAQVLLLTAGYIHRQAPLRLSIIIRSGAHLSIVSNRLAASSPRVRFLGMVIGEALSSLVDKEDKRMDFKMEEMSTLEAKWYKSLVNVSDSVGSLEPLKSGAVAKVPTKPQQKPKKQTSKPKLPQTGSKIISIEEIEDSNEEESDDDGLVPYAKPNEDEEDSNEDPTLITRGKPVAPVYIRELITYLRDSENYDKQKLGLSTAAPLIRRKAGFGTEVSSHAEELATLLVGIQDKYDIDQFQEMRLQGMIAILNALPMKMGQWFSKTFFDGDYSISQRASILTTLGLGAQELGGSGNEGAGVASGKHFPSKELPSSMHNLYSTAKPNTLSHTTVDKLSTQLSNVMIAPVATSLADKLTSPSILKIRTFSSRMEVEKKRKKPIANSLAKIVSDCFFFPLTGRFFIYLKAYGSSHSNVVFQPYLLALFVKTLSLLLHASGPSTLSLPQMTSEFWDLLLSLRTHSHGDVTITESLLFAFLTILEINDDKRRLVDTHGRQILETQEWVEGVFGRTGNGEGEEERVRMLAAGVLVRIREVVEKYQALLMGDLSSF